MGQSVSHKDDIQIDFYEVNVAGGGIYGGADQATLETAFASVLTDARQGTAWTNALTQFCNVSGGVITIFDRCYAPGAQYPWGIAASENDFATSGGSENYKVAAISAFAATLPA